LWRPHQGNLLADGLTIKSPMGVAKIAPVRATADPATTGTVDLVVFLVKLYNTDVAARAIIPMLGRDHRPGDERCRAGCAGRRRYRRLHLGKVGPARHN
jgi:hypothetical protein